jgi:hypothetical protein
MGLQAEGAVSIEQAVRVLQMHVVAGRTSLAMAALPAGEVGQIGQGWHSGENIYSSPQPNPGSRAESRLKPPQRPRRSFRVTAVTQHRWGTLLA